MVSAAELAPRLERMRRVARRCGKLAARASQLLVEFGTEQATQYRLRRRFFDHERRERISDFWIARYRKVEL